MAAPFDPTNPSRRDLDAETLAIPGGVRPVVWRAPGAPPGTLSPQLARMLLDQYTRRGNVVIDIDDDIALAAAAAETERRHYALGGAHRLASLGDTTGYVDLVLLRWPRPQAANPRWLLVACRALLRAGGILVIAVTVADPQRVPHLSALAGAAQAAGLRHVRHVAVIDPDTPAPAARLADADGMTSPARATGAADAAGGHAAGAVRRLTPHTDLLVFVAEAGHHA